MFNLIHKNKKGISLVELLTVITIMGFALSLISQILGQGLRVYNVAERRWATQSAVQLACRKFEKERDSLANAYEADLFYDTTVAQGVFLDSNGYIDGWVSGDSKSYTMPAEGDDLFTDPDNNKYTYIFSAPVYDRNITVFNEETQTNEYKFLGTFLFIRGERGENQGADDGRRSKPFLENEGMGDVPVKVGFSLADNVEIRDNAPNSNPDGVDPSDYHYYTQTIHIKLSAGETSYTDYCVETEYALLNTATTNKRINYAGGGLVFDEEWLGSGNASQTYAKACPAGWTDISMSGAPMINSEKQLSVTVKYNDGGSVKTASLSTDCVAINYVDGAGETQSVNLPTKPENLPEGYLEDEDFNCYVNNEANVMRFVSPTAYYEKGSTDSMTGSANMASCLTKLLFADGSKMSEYVLSSLRDFRDNVLAGSQLGDLIIHEYYYTWSPFLIQNAGKFKPVIKAVLVPVSVICDLIS